MFEYETPATVNDFWPAYLQNDMVELKQYISTDRQNMLDSYDALEFIGSYQQNIGLVLLF